MKNLLLMIFIGLSSQVFAFQETLEGGEISYNPEDWPKYTLKLSPDGTLQDIFEAGLRPYRIPGEEHSSLMFKHCHLKVETPNGKLLPSIEIAYAEVDVKTAGLARLATKSQIPGLTIEQAKKRMMKWLPLISKTEEELDAFLIIVSENFLNYDDRDFGKAPEGFSGTFYGSHGESYSIGLSKSWNANYPLQIRLFINWKLTLKERLDLTLDPIKPPAGYENVSMEAPEHWGPDSAATIAKWRGEDIGDGTGTEFKMRPPGWEPGQEETLPPPKREPKPKIVEKKTPEPEKKSSLPWIIAGVLLLGILLLFLKTFKGKSKS